MTPSPLMELLSSLDTGVSNTLTLIYLCLVLHFPT